MSRKKPKWFFTRKFYRLNKWEKFDIKLKLFGVYWLKLKVI